MELFKNSNFDFLGKKWIFFGASLVLTVAGLLSLIIKGGPRYGIEFTGGALMEVRWATPPPPSPAKIRAALLPLLPGISVVAAHDSSGSDDTIIGTRLRSDADLEGVRQRLTRELTSLNSPFSIRSFEYVGPQIGSDLRRQAVLATAAASAGMLAYLALRFELSYGVAAVTAVLHDTLITLGLFSLTDQEVSMTVVAALLTLIGYSMNDTIVVFDRIRENRLARCSEPLERLVNTSINQTLSRTVLTSGLTLLTALSLLLFGGPVLHGFAFALVVGIIVGTYSSIFIASPILIGWRRLSSGGVR
jgi:preprotein translocase subunit SecF